MYCSVKDCINNMDGYCDIINYISIDENGQCEDMIVRGNATNQESHGRWIDCGNKLECSICGKKVFLGTDDQGVHDEEKALHKFCFNCGTPMNEVGDNSKQKASYEEVRVGQWTPYEYYISEDSNCLIDKTVVRVDPISFRCSLCGRIEEKQEPYCHCGAKMKAWND